MAQYAIAASAEALEDAALTGNPPHRVQQERVGVVTGTCFGSVGTFREQIHVLHNKGPARVQPFLIPNIVTSTTSGQVSILHGFTGPTCAVNAACASGNNALLKGFLLIQAGFADIVVCIGVDACVEKAILASASSLKALTNHNDTPQTTSRPFDNTRDGFVLGEGACVLVLESLDHARHREVEIHAEVLGFGLSSDAYHITAPEPNGEGVAQALRSLFQTSGLRSEEIDYINMHATSTPLGDAGETRGIKSALGGHAYRVALSSTKSMTGHMIGASATAEAIATILAMKHNRVPPTINFEHPDPDCDLDYTFHKAAERNVRVGVSNFFGFGGQNTTVAFQKYAGNNAA
jgi:3-oxoacyl-[acyl-carrier-protein] synthase II